jgi:hypothetical protein
MYYVYKNWSDLLRLPGLYIKGYIWKIAQDLEVVAGSGGTVKFWFRRINLEFNVICG